MNKATENIGQRAQGQNGLVVSVQLHRGPVAVFVHYPVHQVVRPLSQSR